MSAVVPHYKMGPANYQAATLIYGGQWVMPNNVTPGTTDLTVKLAVAAAGQTIDNALGVAGNDANVIATQTGAANAYGEPLIDLSVLTDYVSVYYGHVDIRCWYSGQVAPSGLVQVTGVTANAGTVIAYADQGGTFAVNAGVASAIVGRCTEPGGVASAQLTQQIGGQGAASYYLGRVRVMI
jgi:hypothetical protein